MTGAPQVRDPEAGVTLIETMVALVLLVIVLSGLLSMAAFAIE